MRKITALFLALFMLTSLFACNFKTPVADDEKNKNPVIESDNENNIKYKDDQILFVATDRCDIEGDRNKIYFYNHKGELLDSTDSLSTGYYSENGLAPATDRLTGMVGFVDKDGVFQIEPRYADAAPFSKDGIALVKIVIEENGDTVEKCGYINSKGEEITPFVYDYATSFFDAGYALAEIKKHSIDNYGYTHLSAWKECIIDKNGNSVIEIDVTIEDRRIKCVYEDYFVCETSSGLVIFDYSDNKLCEIDSCIIEKDGVYNYTSEKIEKFDGEKFVEVESCEEIFPKRVATTQSGWGYGIETETGEILIPFEYDAIYIYGEYFVAIKYTGEKINFDQVFDIYDMNYTKTAENIEFAFSLHRYEPYGERCQLPNGYFPIIIRNEDYESVEGIIDYTGKVIVEPVFGRGIILYTYEGTAVLEW